MDSSRNNAEFLPPTLQSLPHAASRRRRKNIKKKLYEDDRKPYVLEVSESLSLSVFV
jgi:hypothetical protein